MTRSLSPQNLVEAIPDQLSSEDNSTESESSESSESSMEENLNNSTDATAPPSDSSESSETSESSESNEMGQIQTKDCVNGTQSCESESDEYFFQGIGDDSNFIVDSLMAPDDSERELHLRR